MSAAALQASPAKAPTPHRIVRPPRLVPAEEIDHDSAEGRRHFYEHVCVDLIDSKKNVKSVDGLSHLLTITTGTYT